MSVVGVDVIDC